MPSKQISPHEVRIVAALSTGRWTDTDELVKATGTQLRTANLHLSRLAADGVIEQVKAWPRFRYRLTPELIEANRDYFRWLADAADALGIPFPEVLK